MDESHYLPTSSVIGSGHRLKTVGTLLTLLLCVLTLTFSQFTFVLHVQVDGAHIGTVPDTLVLGELIDTAEETMGTLLGQHYDVGERVSYTLSFVSVSGAESLNLSEVEQGMFHHIDGVDMKYVVSIDGTPVGYVPDFGELQAAKDQRISLLMEGGTVSAGFICEVAYDFRLVDLDRDTAVEDIPALVERLSMETTEQVITTEPIPFEVEIILDDRRFEDSVEVLQEGLDGKKEIITLVTYIDDLEIEQTVLQTNILAEPVSEILMEGTKERPLTASFGYYIWPTTGNISSRFGPRRVRVGSSNHRGIDISAPHGTPIVAADGGEVIFVGWLGGFGNLIQIRHDNGHVTYYAHLSSMSVSVGERVYRGQHIGGMGMTGTATGVHLHFEIRINDIPVDPLLHLP